MVVILMGARQPQIEADEGVLRGEYAFVFLADCRDRNTERIVAISSC